MGMEVRALETRIDERQSSTDIRLPTSDNPTTGDIRQPDSSLSEVVSRCAVVGRRLPLRGCRSSIVDCRTRSCLTPCPISVMAAGSGSSASARRMRDRARSNPRLQMEGLRRPEAPTPRPIVSTKANERLEWFVPFQTFICFGNIKSAVRSRAWIGRQCQVFQVHSQVFPIQCSVLSSMSQAANGLSVEQMFWLASTPKTNGNISCLLVLINHL